MRSYKAKIRWRSIKINMHDSWKIQNSMALNIWLFWFCVLCYLVLWLLQISTKASFNSTQLNWDFFAKGCSTSSRISLISWVQRIFSWIFEGFSGPVSAAQNPCCIELNWGVQRYSAVFVCAWAPHWWAPELLDRTNSRSDKQDHRPIEVAAVSP